MQVLNASNPDCDEECIPINMQPFYVRDVEGVCFLVPNQCVLQSLVCTMPEMGFDVILDGSCGGVPV